MVGAPIRQVAARAYEVPTDTPEADGTLSWDRTTLVVVDVDTGAAAGLGYTYADAALVGLVERKLARVLVGRDAFDIAGATQALWRSVRNLGRGGLAATAISALDLALFDLKAKLLGLPLASLLGRAQERVAIYGSGGFTNYSDARLRDQLVGWIEREGCRWLKMKIGSEPQRDPARVRTARQAIGHHGLFVDANGAFTTKQALDLAERFAELGVVWFEEPVSSDDLTGLDLVRRSTPAGMEVAAGEYGYTLDDFARLTDGPCVDVLQADVTRCGGVTGLLHVGALSAARHIELSGHCAPAAHLAVACAIPHLRHLEWFHDHVRIEHMLFEGAPQARDGAITPDLTRSGLGLALKECDAERFRVR
jgi:L-alanine-DL-glutamate epimerase-like enolase superfamily enzyme